MAAAGSWVAVVAVSSLFTASYVWKVLAVAIRSAPAPPELRPLGPRAAWSGLGLAFLTLVLGAVPGILYSLAPVGLPGWLAGGGP